MTLDRIWGGMLIIAIIVALINVLFGDTQSADALITAVFDTSKLAVNIAIGLVGVLCFWLGVFQLAKDAGLIARLARLVSPLLTVLMPGVPRGHPAQASVTMNLAANMLGLDNAATPLGLQAMRDLQTLNPSTEQASNAQVLFLVLNTSSVTLLPVTVFMYRQQLGAAAPTDVFVGILLATLASTIVGLLAVGRAQRLPLWRKPIWVSAALLMAVIASIVGFTFAAGQQLASERATLLANVLMLLVLLGVAIMAWRKHVPLYESFITGAKEGFATAVQLIPFLVAMLVAIAMLRACGVLEWLLSGVRYVCHWLALDTRWVDALPVALAKPFSGSAARGLLIDAMQTHGADSLVGRMASVMQGSTETTFYVLAVYMGAVGLRRARNAVGCGLLADSAGLITAILVSYWLFG